jgi:hypothetical protein
MKEWVLLIYLNFHLKGEQKKLSDIYSSEQNKGIFPGYEYDGLNRLVKIDYPESADNDTKRCFETRNLNLYKRQHSRSIRRRVDLGRHVVFCRRDFVDSHIPVL